MRTRLFCFLILFSLASASSVIAARTLNATVPDRLQPLPVTPEPVKVTLSIKEAFTRMDAVYTAGASRRNMAVYYGIIAVRSENKLLLVECTGRDHPDPECKPKAEFQGTSADLATTTFYGKTGGPKVWITTNTSAFICDLYRAGDHHKPWRNCKKMADLPVRPGNATAPQIEAAAQNVETGRTTIAWAAIKESQSSSGTATLLKCVDFGSLEGCSVFAEMHDDILSIEVDVQWKHNTDVWITTPGTIGICDSAGNLATACRTVWFLAPDPPGLSVD